MSSHKIDSAARTQVDSDLSELIREVLERPVDPNATMTDLRADAVDLFAWMRGEVDPDLSQIDVRNDMVGSVPVRWYGAPQSSDRDLILFIHGGGWILGNLDSHDMDARLVASLTSASVIAVDYRLAPEHPFPAAIDDCVSVARSLVATPHRGLGLMGDSSGGNLAVSTALAIGRTGGIDALLALYPVIDPDAVENSSYRDNGQDYLLTADAMKLYWSMYAPAAEDRANQLAAPLRGDLTDMPATVVASANFDPLRDENQDLAARLVVAGVDTTHLPHPGLIHGFQQMQRVPAARRALREAYQAFLLAIQRGHSRRIIDRS